MKRIFSVLTVVFMLSCGELFAATIDVFEMVTSEPSGGVQLTFKVKNNSGVSIRAFAVGNNSATDLSPVFIGDGEWAGNAVLTRSDTASEWELLATDFFFGDPPVDIAWLSNVNDLDAYTRAFYFSNPREWGDLGAGEQREFSGYAAGPNSPVVLLGIDSGGAQVVYSGMHTTVVPLPPAVWLFLSGIAGLSVLTQRRKKGVSRLLRLT